MSNKADDTVKLLVFKDQFPARSFEIDLRFISRLGWGILFLVLISLFCIGLSIRFYRQTLHTSPVKVQELQKELAELKASKKDPALAQDQTPDLKSDGTLAPSLTGLTPAIPAAEALGQWPRSFFPPSITVPAAGFAPPISVNELQFKWQGKNLRVSFNVEYSKGDNGNQQGRILLIARGTSSIQTYPERTLNTTSGEALFLPQEGEHFSVSRFRGVLALFGPYKTPADVGQIDVYIFSDEQNLLIHKSVLVNENDRGTAEE